MPHFNPYIPSGTQSQSFLSPDFTPIQFPSGTPAVPLQPQYLSSDGGSSTPSTPASTRSTSSNSGSGERSKARTYDRDPKYPDDALYWHSKHNGKCPDCKQADSLTKPKWHSHKKRLFIKCTNTTCKYWRHTDYYSDPPSSTSASAAAIPPGTTLPCVAEPCTTGNKRNRNVACANRMCLQDCVKHGPLECSTHKRAKHGTLGSSTTGRPSSVLFQGLSLPSMPSIPPSMSLPSSLPPSTPLSSAPSYLDAAFPPSSPNPANPRSLTDITTSTVKPTLDNPLPRPAASPLEEGPTFQEVRRYARELPNDWAAVITAQQSAKAQQMLYEAQFRTHIKEGLSITVVFWRARLGIAPFLFERVVHHGRDYSLSEDVDLCTAVGFDPTTVFVLNYFGGMWSHRSPRERHAVKPGCFLFFREAGPQVIAYEDPLLRFDELLALATDPAFGEASSFLASSPTAPPSPSDGPRPRPRPRAKPLGLPKVDHRYNWITSRSTASVPDTQAAITQASSEPTPSPVTSSTASSSPTGSSTANSSAASSSTTNSSSSIGSNNSVSKRNWPDDYTVKEIHGGFVFMTNQGRPRKGSGIKIWDRFFAAFPDAERWISRRYYSAWDTWRSHMVTGNAAEQNAFKAWLKMDASWTSIFGGDAGTPPPKKRKVEVHMLVDSD